MTITKDYRGYVLYCDYCHEVSGIYDYFDEAVEIKKENGWRSEKDGQVWRDICPDCQEG